VRHSHHALLQQPLYTLQKTNQKKEQVHDRAFSKSDTKVNRGFNTLLSPTGADLNISHYIFPTHRLMPKAMTVPGPQTQSTRKAPLVQERKYKCAYCARAFSRSEHRSRHERSRMFIPKFGLIFIVFLMLWVSRYERETFQVPQMSKHICKAGFAIKT